MCIFLQYFTLLCHKLSKFRYLYLQLINQFNTVDKGVSHNFEIS